MPRGVGGFLQMKPHIVLLIVAVVTLVSGIFTQQSVFVLIAAALASIASFEDALSRHDSLAGPEARTRRRIEALKWETQISVRPIHTFGQS